MSPITVSPRESSYLRRSRIAALIVSGIGALVLLGWVANIPILRGSMLHDEVMKTNTALCLMMGGLSLLSFHSRRFGGRTLVGGLCGSIVMLVGAATVAEYLFGWNPGIDQWIVRELPQAAVTYAPGRMAFSAAFCFMLVGGALVLLHQGWSAIINVLAMSAITLTLFMLVGSIFGTPNLLASVQSTPMAFLTGCSMILLSFGIVIAVPTKGVAQLFIGDSVGGHLLRVVFAGLFIVPILLGWLLVQGLNRSWFDPAYGVALLVFGIVAVSAVRSLMAARWLNRLDEQLHSRERMFGAMIEHSADVVALLNADLEVTYVSPSVRSLLGYAPEEIIGRMPGAFTHPDDVQLMGMTIESLRSLPGATRNVRLRERHKDGSWRWVDVIATNLLEEPGIRAIVSNHRDITDRKNAEDALVAFHDTLEQRIAERTRELSEMNNELRTFSYSVSHDLRAPLSRIHGFAHLLEEEHSGMLNDEGKQFVKIISSNATQLGTMMDSLLAYSELHNQPFTVEDIDVQELVRKAWRSVVPRSSGTAVDFSVDALPAIRGDALMLQQLFAHILSNAVQFTARSSPAIIHVTGEQIPGFALIHVKDNGAGFPPEKRDELFTMFYRLDATAEYEGLGVGLAFARRYAERHGGTITATGEPGTGAVFTVKLAL